LREVRVAAELNRRRPVRASRLKDIERGEYALISHHASLVPQGRPPELGNRVYGTMRLRVFAHRDPTLIADPG
jgi:hypothetical protein